MGYELRFDADDVARLRFVVSPLWEVTQAVRSLMDPPRRQYHLPWIDEIRPLLAELDLLPLLAVQPRRGYTPDLIAPLPRTARTTAADQLAQVRTTPLDDVRRELRRAASERAGEPVPAEFVELARRPREARARIADSLEACWHTLIEPYWPRIEDLLRADITYHSRLLADAGLERLMPALHPEISWQGRSVRIAQPPRKIERVDARGRGVLLQPSAFAWPKVVVVTDEPYQPAVIYPARGVAELWQPRQTSAHAALATLLGRTRAILLASVREPATTTTLARRHDLAAATVSEHLSALAGAGLVTATRFGRTVSYAATRLGNDLLAAPEVYRSG